jgi:hypothetical protein
MPSAIDKSTSIAIGLVMSIVCLGFCAGIAWQRINYVESNLIITQQLLRETRAIAVDNKLRIDIESKK